jgi:hypothetical protein
VLSGRKDELYTGKPGPGLSIIIIASKDQVMATTYPKTSSGEAEVAMLLARFKTTVIDQSLVKVLALTQARPSAKVLKLLGGFQDLSTAELKFAPTAETLDVVVAKVDDKWPKVQVKAGTECYYGFYSM